MAFINKKTITILSFIIISLTIFQLSAGDYDKPFTKNEKEMIELVKAYVSGKPDRSPLSTFQCKIPAPVQRYQPKSLTHQATQQIGKYIINLYEQNDSNAHEKVKEYLSQIPWETQLVTFNELLNSLPNDPAWYDKNKGIIFHDPYPEISKTKPESPLIFNKRKTLKNILLDYLNDKTLPEDSYSDIASVIFDHQEQLLPHSMVLIDILDPEQSKLLTYAPQARLDALAIEIAQNIVKNDDIQNLFPLIKGTRNNILLGTSLEQRQRLIDLIDSWIRNKSINIYAAITKQVVSNKLYDSDIKKLEWIKPLINPLIKSAPVE